MEDVFASINLKNDDVILYMGGRIDDDNLYPKEYTKYLNNQIKKLNPDKIICHNHWYAKKYYEKGILDKHTKIDLIVVNYDYVRRSIISVIDPSHYEDHREWMRKLIDINPNIVYGMYCPHASGSETATIYEEWFGKNYKLERVKYFKGDRSYSAEDLTEGNVSKCSGANSSDGFNIFSKFVQSGFENLNLLGFSAFGCGEDSSNFTKYGEEDIRFSGKTYFNLQTSEDLCAESNILKYWSETNKINFLENYAELISALREKNNETKQK